MWQLITIYNPVMILVLLLGVLLFLCLVAVIWGITSRTKNILYIESHVVSDMKKKLEKAAQTELSLSIGRELQKKFLPLETDNDGNSCNYGWKIGKKAIFFGYYEGAGGVSGDYFDYKDLDGRYYAIIKCDVAGKGVPAALLMVVVATMFNNYFKDWKRSLSGMRIEELVYHINDLIETLGFKGRFAAFTLCLFDSETGDLHFCNAGDNRIHVCDASDKLVKSITLPQTPAAGILTSNMVKSKCGYQVQTITLGQGDILLLFTDGIEDSKCCEGSEEFGSYRVNDIINAVLNRRTYSLHASRNHGEDQDLSFDYSLCSGNAEDIIMALICAEKMFRCYRDSTVTKNDRVPVDKKVDAFLKKHFMQYQYYCSLASKNPDNNFYMYYNHLKEDTQYDDLAILGIERK